MNKNFEKFFTVTSEKITTEERTRERFRVSRTEFIQID